MPSVAITGARGLLGSTLMRTLNRPTALTADVRDKEAVRREVQESGADWIVHAAALTNVAECERDPERAHAVHVLGTEHVLAAAKEKGARVIYISTASVFKGDRGDYTENDLPEPLNVYNRTKAAGEQKTFDYEHGRVLRLNLIGVHPDGSRGKNFLEWLLDSLRDDKDMTLFMDSRINPLSNWTIAELIKKNIEQDIQERILHIGSRDVLSKADIARLLLTHFPDYAGTLTEGTLDAIADGVWRPKEMWLNTDRAQALLGRMPSLEEEIALVWEKLTQK